MRGATNGSNIWQWLDAANGAGGWFWVGEGNLVTLLFAHFSDDRLVGKGYCRLFSSCTHTSKILENFRFEPILGWTNKATYGKQSLAIGCFL